LYGDNYDYYLPIVEQLAVFNQIQSEGKFQDITFDIVVIADNSVKKEYFQNTPVRLLDAKLFDRLKNVPPKMWRYYNVFFTQADVYLFRDSDSIINTRELDFINQWLDSPFGSNVFRDSRLHLYPIMGGTFGVRNNSLLKLRGILSSSVTVYPKDKHFYDQIFLAEVVYPLIMGDLLVFTNFISFKGENTIRTEYRNSNFIGGYFKNNTLKEHWHDGVFLENIPVNILKMSFYKTRVILFFLSFFIILDKIKKNYGG
jgi:hypothetical protein